MRGRTSPWILGPLAQPFGPSSAPPSECGQLLWSCRRPGRSCGYPLGVVASPPARSASGSHVELGRLLPASSSRQKSRTSPGPMSALASMRVPAKRAACRARAAGRTPPGPLADRRRGLAQPLVRQLFQRLEESPPPAVPRCGYRSGPTMAPRCASGSG